MALSDSVLKELIVTEMESKGFVTSGEHARSEQLAEAIAKAVVSHITSSADVAVTAGSSAGSYKVS
jgi:hypothetical protein